MEDLDSVFKQLNEEKPFFQEQDLVRIQGGEYSGRVGHVDEYDWSEEGSTVIVELEEGVKVETGWDNIKLEKE